MDNLFKNKHIFYWFLFFLFSNTLLANSQKLNPPKSKEKAKQNHSLVEPIKPFHTITTKHEEIKIHLVTVYLDSPNDEPKLPLNQLVVLNIEIIPKIDSSKKFTSPVLSDFDFVMPGHGHGMLTKAKVINVADRNFRVEGVKAHMKGDWEFRLSIVRSPGAKPEVVSSKYIVE